LRSITFSQCLYELFCNPYAPFFTGSLVLICLAGMVTFAGEALLVEKVDQYKARGGTTDCWGIEDLRIDYSKRPVEQLIGLMRNPVNSKAKLAINRLEEIGVEAAEALPALSKIVHEHSSLEFKNSAHSAIEVIESGM